LEVKLLGAGGTASSLSRESRCNNASRWVEFEMGFFAMKCFDKLKIIKVLAPFVGFFICS
jgi:hypothetical protein